MKGILSTNQSLRVRQAVVGGGSAPAETIAWNKVTNKPFNTVDTEGGLTIQDNTLMIDTLDTIATIDYVNGKIDEVEADIPQADGTTIVDNNGVWSAVGGGTTTVDWDDVQNKPTFATVATSGDYDDLSNKPTIPSIDGLATEQYVDDAIADIDIPEDVSELNNDAGYITNSALSGYATETYVDSAVDGITTTLETDYATKAELPVATSDLTNDSGFITASALTPYAESADLAAVATSGSYNDLSNKPTIPQPTSVTVTQTLSSGTAIADIDVDGVTTTLYAPQGGGSVTIDNKSLVRVNGVIQEAVPIYSEERAGTEYYGPGLYADNDFEYPSEDMDYYFDSPHFSLYTDDSETYRFAIKLIDGTVYDGFWDASPNGFTYGGDDSWTVGSNSYQLYISEEGGGQWRLHLWMGWDFNPTDKVEKICLYQVGALPSGYDSLSYICYADGLTYDGFDNSGIYYHKLPSEYIDYPIPPLTGDDKYGDYILVAHADFGRIEYEWVDYNNLNGD